MDTPAQAQSASERYSQIASPIHTILVLAALGGWVIWHARFAQLNLTANPSRVHFYVVTMFFEWLLFVLVVAGVRRRGGSVLIVLGDHWHSARQMVRDIGIAAAFWIVAWVLLWILGWLLRIAALGRNVSMLPHRGIELILWVALSVTAGICEETIFRGYLQRQFTALTNNAPAGIFLAAATFGAAHAYQGVRMMILIALYGAMFGILAYWRGSVRPGMIAHAWQDSFNGVLATVMKH
jgi:membrane protease YdiL (CAAX protease family)